MFVIPMFVIPMFVIPVFVTGIDTVCTVVVMYVEMHGHSVWST